MSNCTDLVKALRANIADPTNVTWRAVLAALRRMDGFEADRSSQGDSERLRGGVGAKKEGE